MKLSQSMCLTDWRGSVAKAVASIFIRQFEAVPHRRLMSQVACQLVPKSLRPCIVVVIEKCNGRSRVTSLRDRSNGLAFHPRIFC
jgi:hypothetical protein